MSSIRHRLKRLEKKANVRPIAWEFLWKHPSDPPNIYRGKDGRQYRHGGPDWPQNVIAFVHMDVTEL